ncbi:MAG: hypothetical protein GEU87_10170 [Alphaproteobacteria bacterium]|nr:hypothetical protein [Alphaproteobacteria bacterium]
MKDAATLAQSLDLRKTGSVYVGDCPSCGYNGSFTARDLDSILLIYCHSCRDQKAILDTLREQGLWGVASFDRIAELPAGGALYPSRRKDNTAYATQLWAMGKACAGSPVETYLRRRGITLSVPPSLRYLKQHRHAPSATFWPVMVGAVVVEGEPPAFAGIHRTYKGYQRVARGAV